ncbi:hypothetical protein DM02DRAFT_646190 [Periconia macrospinosa]|uniref:Uncharacterized protein n=1 Tax=Periconia macrospinosa TaxID=97972 RepID=A0A2V1D9S0_9PLEO|nr:hypothetical protein DM02DRAFT_646190 [Periconia macrospinosa]
MSLQNAKLNTILTDSRRGNQDTQSISDMPPPPAYYTVMDPTPNEDMHSSYNPEDDKDEEETPEITVNASTQIRGHGNIISIAQMDSARIASLVAMLLYGNSPQTASQQQQQQPSSPEQAQVPSPELSPQPHNERLYHARKVPKMIINVNCGATVVGDRNIVGPGLGDIARHMQIAQRNQALAAQQQQQQNQMNANRTAATGANLPAVAPPTPGLGFPIHAQPPAPHPTTVTPPMSRSSSFGSEGSSGIKRKSEGPIEESAAKRSC